MFGVNDKGIYMAGNKGAGIANTIINGLSTLWDIGTGAYQMANNEREFKYQQELDAWNKDMATKNYQLAMDQMNWQQQAQETAWSREDDAIRRRVADLESAGMSKWLAAGQGAQAGGITASNVTSGANLINSGARLKDVNLKNAVDSFLTGAERQAGISLTKKQEELLQANIDNVNQDTINKSVGVDKIKAEIDQINNDVQKTIEQLELQKQQFEEQKKLWESEKNKNSAQAVEAKNNALRAKTEAAKNVQNLKTYKTFYQMEIDKHDQLMKNYKIQNATGIVNAVGTQIKNINEVIQSWVPFGKMTKSIGFRP